MPDQSRSPKTSSPREALTRTELTVLELVDAGLSNGEIAGQLEIGVGTVKWHLHRVFEKLQVRNRIEAVAKARQQGVLSSGAAAIRRGSET